MLNPFPELLFLQPFAPFIIRVAIGVFLIIFSWQKIHKDPKSFRGLLEYFHITPPSTYAIAIGCIEAAVGIFLIVGYMTQIMAIIAMVIFLMSFILKVRHADKIVHSRSLYVLLFILSFTLILTGAGIPAIDLPL